MGKLPVNLTLEVFPQHLLWSMSPVTLQTKLSRTVPMMTRLLRTVGLTRELESNVTMIVSTMIVEKII